MRNCLHSVLHQFQCCVQHGLKKTRTCYLLATEMSWMAIVVTFCLNKKVLLGSTIVNE